MAVTKGNPGYTAGAVRPWARRGGESVQAHQGLLAYLELGGERTIVKAAELVKVERATAERWSRTFDWGNRAVAYDSHEADIRQSSKDKVVAATAEEWARRRLEQAEQDFRLAEALRKRAWEMLAHPLTRQKVRKKDGAVIVSPVKWNTGHIATLAKLAHDLGDLAIRAAMPEEDKALEGRLDEETEATILKVYGAAEGDDEAQEGEAA